MRMRGRMCQPAAELRCVTMTTSNEVAVYDVKEVKGNDYCTGRVGGDMILNRFGASSPSHVYTSSKTRALNAFKETRQTRFY